MGDRAAGDVFERCNEPPARFERAGVTGDPDRDWERARSPPGVVGNNENAGDLVGCGDVARLGRRRCLDSASLRS